MARLLFHVEGRTEYSFVTNILRDHLVASGYYSVGVRIMGDGRLRQQRGGICPWPSVRKEISNHLKQDRGCVATTLVDYYGLPQKGEGAWPGRAISGARSGAEEKALCVERERREGNWTHSGRMPALQQLADSA
jgi:hypothetical protein